MQHGLLWSPGNSLVAATHFGLLWNPDVETMSWKCGLLLSTIWWTAFEAPLQLFAWSVPLPDPSVITCLIANSSCYLNILLLWHPGLDTITMNIFKQTNIDFKAFLSAPLMILVPFVPGCPSVISSLGSLFLGPAKGSLCSCWERGTLSFFWVAPGSHSWSCTRIFVLGLVKVNVTPPLGYISLAVQVLCVQDGARFSQAEHTLPGPNTSSLMHKDDRQSRVLGSDPCVPLAPTVRLPTLLIVLGALFPGVSCLWAQDTATFYTLLYMLLFALVFLWATHTEEGPQKSGNSWGCCSLAFSVDMGFSKQSFLSFLEICWRERERGLFSFLILLSL